MQASPLRLTNAGADGARLYAGDAPPRCLKCESASAQERAVNRRNRASAVVVGRILASHSMSANEIAARP
jgi:hypothetical protein